LKNKDMDSSEEIKLSEAIKSSEEIKPSEDIQIPELEIPGVWKRIIDWMSHIHHVVWILGMTVLLGLLVAFMPPYVWSFLWTGIRTHALLVGFVLFFCLVAVSLVWKLGQRIDVWVFMLFNMHGKRLPWLDWTMLTITQIGNFIFAVVVALFLYFRVSHLLAYELILGILMLGLIVQIMKVLIHRTRPYIKLKNIRIVGSRASGRSFPSGHTCQVFFMATLLLHYFKADLFVWFVLYAIALLVGFTRIYVGMHYPRDVLGGAILGTAWGLFGVIVNSYLSFAG